MTRADSRAALARVRALAADAPFVRWLGVEVVNAGQGWVETELLLTPNHLQQTGVVHAGVQATLADNTAGAAATTVIDDAQTVVSVEFKLNLLRGARGNKLRCRSEVLKSGRRIVVAESAVMVEAEQGPRLVSKATVTLMPVRAARE
ncbi:MAG: PaaI family thioesterase [Pseudomonadota bacterium]